MRVGVVFPQTEIGADPVSVRDYAQSAESLGFDHLLAYDHVLGANAESRPGWGGAYQHTSLFHEPFILFSYLAGITETIEFVSGIIILPQRQTVLVAKQTAALDVLSGGRLRLGIGIGWNQVEYEALGENFHNRGRRSEEQIDVLRQLWTNELVTYDGKWHKITDAGLNPLPVQQPIPIWFGGTSDAVMRRLAKIGDGWFPQRFGPDEEGRRIIETLHSYIADAGRKPSDVGIEPRISVSQGDPDAWATEASAWKELGATHISVNTMGAGFSSTQEHIDAIEKFKEAISSI
jgi:probable F420-dependent oxidoreductase